MIKGFIKFIIKIFAVELIKTYIFSFLGLASLAAAYLYAKDYFINLMKLPIELSTKLLLYQILLILLSLFILIYLIIKIKRNIKTSSYYFIKEGPFKWRVGKYDGIVDNNTYCKKHQIKLNSKFDFIYYPSKVYTFYCDICKKTIARNVHEKNLNSMYQKVIRKAEAKHNRYAKGF